MKVAIDKISFGKLKSIKFHVLFWLALIFYEIPLAGFLTGRWGSFWDYFLHYVLNICLFYFHSIYSLNRFRSGLVTNIFWVITEAMTYFLINILLIILFVPLGLKLAYDKIDHVLILASAYRFVFILLLSTAYWYMLQRIQSVKKIHEQKTQIFKTKLKNKKLKTAMLEEQLSKHKASIVPHFLFNTLHILFHQLRKEKPQEAGYLLSLSEMMQYNLSPLDQQYKIPLSLELAYLKNYVALRQLERSYSLKLTVNVSEELADELQIIPLVMATLVENVFHHGDLYHPSYPSCFSVRLSENKLRIRIKNRVKSVATEKNGIGMANMQTRLAHFYPEQHQYTCYRRRRQYFQKLYIQL